MNIVTQQNLKHYNTMGVDASCEYFITLNSNKDIAKIIQWKQQHSLPIFILGGGSNVLLTKPYIGLIIHPKIKGCRLIKETSHSFFIEAQAGENWHDFVLWCIEQGYDGLENLSLIPGTVGATPVQNIGAYGVEVKDYIDCVIAYDLNTSKPIRFDNIACQFSYRHSLFKTKKGQRYLITSVIFKLPKQAKWTLHYNGLEQVLANQMITAKTISNAIIKIRQNKLPSPTKLGNCGSFFKNPILPLAQWKTLQQQHKHIPCFPIDPNHSETSLMVKTSAAWLIDQCGWKGVREKEAGVYEKHALVLVNHGNATGQEIWDLACKIIQSVEKKFTITLKTEANIL